MAGSTKEQRKEPQEVRFKPFSKVGAEEIRERVGGKIEYDYSDIWTIACCTGDGISRTSSAESDFILQIDGRIEFQQDDPEVILGSDFVTTVSGLERWTEKEGDYTVEMEGLDWVTISARSISVNDSIRKVGQAWPADVTPNILKAAGRASARLQLATKAVQVR